LSDGVFGSDAPAACFPTTCSLWATTLDELQISFEEYQTRLSDQITALNGLILDSVERLIAADPDAVVVLLSDHGMRYSLGDADEHFRTLLAVRSPRATARLPDDLSPVNLFRWVANNYWGGGLELLPYRAWKSAWSETLRLEEITGSEL
jgi:hypothetical protein